MPSLPIGPTGKLDRQALAKMAAEQTAPKRLPQTPRETQIAAMYSEILGLPESGIGIDESFLILGGNSLSAIQLVTRIRNELKLKFEIEQLFNAPTVQGVVSQLADTASLKAFEPIRARPRRR